jgi:hypothetical protein
MIQVARILEKTSCLLIRDPRVSEADNNTFLDTLEKYFEQPHDAKMADARPDSHYQVGVTPEGVEFPRCAVDPSCQDFVAEVRFFPSLSIISLPVFQPQNRA